MRRRAFLGSAVGTTLLGAGCGSRPASRAAESEATSPRLDPRAAGMPFRQDDPAWGRDVMWDRELVVRADHELNGAPLARARALLRRFEDGNTIANEGCLLTSLAMVLQLLVPRTPPWTPRTLNQEAQARYFYTRAGVSMAPLVADLVSDVTDGAVQLALKEEYLAGEPGWPKVSPGTSGLVRAYRSLAPEQRTRFVVLLKTGTHDDTVASHYLLLHPNDEGTPDDANPRVLDPAQPLADRTDVWRLSDSAAAITKDTDIAGAWRAAGVTSTQIGGAWVYAARSDARGRPAIAPLARAWARELSRS